MLQVLEMKTQKKRIFTSKHITKNIILQFIRYGLLKFLVG